MKIIKFSIIVPTYNRAQSLYRCVQSVLSSRMTDIELIVSDNASPDGTQKVLGAFKDDRIRYWCNDTNLGPVKNIMKLLHAARGAWVFCLTDDDYLLPNALDRLAHVITTSNDVGVIRTGLKIVDQNGDEIGDYRFHKDTAIFQPGMESLTHLFWAAHVFSGLIARREWLDLVGTEKYLYTMYPQMYFVGAILKEHPGIYLDECLVAHTTNNETFWAYPTDFMVKSRIEMINNMLPGERWKHERSVLIKQIIKEIKHHFRLSMSKSPLQLVYHQLALLQIREVIFSPSYWFSLLQFFGAVGHKFCTKIIAIPKRFIEKIHI